MISDHELAGMPAFCDNDHPTQLWMSTHRLDPSLFSNPNGIRLAFAAASGTLGAQGYGWFIEQVVMVGLDSCLIQNPSVWVASGHVGGFNDPMMDCRQSKRRYRADHLLVLQGRHSKKRAGPVGSSP